jgi:hypothetical protein
VCDFFGLQHPHHSADWPSRESSALEPGSAKTNSNGMYIPSIFATSVSFSQPTDHVKRRSLPPGAICRKATANKSKLDSSPPNLLSPSKTQG